LSYGPKPWLQRHWDWRAATNFTLGGTGAGLMVSASLVSIESPYPFILGLLLVAAGLGAVWLEIGRKLRAVNVFFNPFTSWMTRESFAAVLLFALGISAVLFEEKMLFYGAAIAALAFAWCQARMLRAAKGIPAWRAPQVVPLIVTTALAEGAGLCLFFASGALSTALFALALIARALAWSRYHAAVRSPALGSAGGMLLQVGTVVPLALVIAGFGFPEISFVANAFAAAAAIGMGWRLKFALVTRAAFNQGFALPHLPVRGTR